MNFKDMPIRELREYAKTNGIPLQSATKKADIVAILDQAVPAETEPLTFEAPAEENPSVVTAPTEQARQAQEDEEIARRLEAMEEVATNAPAPGDDKVCVYSERRYSSSKLGKMELGYNIVKEDIGRIWIRLPDVRAASKDELARAKAAGIKPGELAGPKGRRM